MASWQDLEDEVNIWADAGRTIRLWWRDDDAVRVTPALEKLATLSSEYDIPLVLAVIPDRMQTGLARFVGKYGLLSVVQHGFSHENHALPGVKSSEYPATRNSGAMITEIAIGWSRLSEFEKLNKVFVPPWNRIDMELAGQLQSVGYTAISVFGPRSKDAPWFINTHGDLIDWRGHRGFADETTVLAQLRDHLRGKRLGQYDNGEPTGMLTHHLNHDDGCWAFIKTFLDWTRKQQAVEWLSGDQLFGHQKGRGELND